MLDRNSIAVHLCCFVDSNVRHMNLGNVSIFQTKFYELPGAIYYYCNIISSQCERYALQSISLVFEGGILDVTGKSGNIMFLMINSSHEQIQNDVFWELSVKYNFWLTNRNAHHNLKTLWDNSNDICLVNFNFRFPLVTFRILCLNTNLSRACPKWARATLTTVPDWQFCVMLHQRHGIHSIFHRATRKDLSFNHRSSKTATFPIVHLHWHIKYAYHTRFRLQQFASLSRKRRYPALLIQNPKCAFEAHTLSIFDSHVHHFSLLFFDSSLFIYLYASLRMAI